MNVQIGPYNYTIEFSEESMNNKRVLSNDNNCIGYCNYEKQTITIDPTLAADMQKVCVMHEILHAIMFTVGINSLEESTQEQIVESVSANIVDTMRRNPHVVQYLMDGKIEE